MLLLAKYVGISAGQGQHFRAIVFQPQWTWAPFLCPQIDPWKIKYDFQSAHNLQSSEKAHSNGAQLHSHSTLTVL